MQSNLKQFILPLIIVATAFAAVFVLSSKLEHMRPSLPNGYQDSDLVLEGKRLKGYVMGAEGLLADWYWILSLQYIGGKIVESSQETINLDDLTSLTPWLLYPYLDNATDLDPKFSAAYSYGAAVLPAIDPQKAIDLMAKGIRNNPENWRLYQYLGYIYWRQKKYQAAADTYEAGSKISGAPPFMRQMVASMKSKGGDRETARLMYQQMFSEAEDEQSKRNAQLRLYEIDSLEERDAVNRILLDFKQHSGRCPAAFADIFPELRSVTLPAGKEFQIDRSNDIVDPTGIPYVLDKKKCEMVLDPESKIPKSIS